MSVMDMMISVLVPGAMMKGMSIIVLVGVVGMLKCALMPPSALNALKSLLVLDMHREINFVQSVRNNV